MTSLITPDWPALQPILVLLLPPGRGAAVRAPFDSNNLALHVADAESAVRANRQALIDELGLSRAASVVGSGTWHRGRFMPRQPAAVPISRCQFYSDQP
jgi:hypothetical protein